MNNHSIILVKKILVDYIINLNKYYENELNSINLRKRQGNNDLLKK